MFDPSLLAGRVALVNGATRPGGLGATTAAHLGRAGARTVVITGRNEAAGATMQASLQRIAPDTRFEFVVCDYTQPEQVETLFARIKQTSGRLDIFVHTGMNDEVMPKPFVDTLPHEWHKQVQGFFLSLVDCARHAVTMMREQKAGAIVAYTSDAAKVPTPGEVVQGACLAASTMFIKTLALELGRDNIRANVLTPSIVAGTQGYENLLNDDFAKRVFGKAIKRARLGVASAENIAPMAVFLASPLASHITGQAISVNGGISVA